MVDCASVGVANLVLVVLLTASNCFSAAPKLGEDGFKYCERGMNTQKKIPRFMLVHSYLYIPPNSLFFNKVYPIANSS